MVLGLVEPDSSGIGGGGFLVHYTGSSDEDRRLRWPRMGAGRGNAGHVHGGWQAAGSFELAQASGKRSIGTPALIADAEAGA
jgi:gamma-glutamyltranspeptidase/glutathione hydrolase